jgi:hypothetical protein
MPGCPGFLRPPTELTARLCPVNFDGKRALEHSKQLGLDRSLEEDFVQRHCAPVYEGVMVDKGCYKLAPNDIGLISVSEEVGSDATQMKAWSQ